VSVDEICENYARRKAKITVFHASRGGFAPVPEKEEQCGKRPNHLHLELSETRC